MLSVLAFALFTTTVQAKTYTAPDGKSDVTISGCVLVDTSSEKDSTHVYTLNPDHVWQLRLLYLTHWNREPRCDELQFHVDHNTTLSRLSTWLRDTAYTWYRQLGSTHFNNQTVSTGKHEWFFVQNGVLRRIPDILTGWSWGLLAEDRLSIPNDHTDYFYAHTMLGSPLNFSGGSYTSTIHSIWKDGNRDYSSLPVKLRESIDTLVSGYADIMNLCGWHGASSTDRSFGDLYDWSWMQRNPGCPLAGR